MSDIDLGKHAYENAEPLPLKFLKSDGTITDEFPGGGGGGTGPPGPPGANSDITVYSDTETEYILQITQADGSTFLTPNLRTVIGHYGFY